MSEKKRPRFDTHYPTRAELEYYNEKLMFKKLSVRMEDRTLENIVKDASIRREASGIIFVRQVMFQIMVYTDIKVVLGLASKILMVLEFVLDENFWKQKRLYEFPEMNNYVKFDSERTSYFYSLRVCSCIRFNMLKIKEMQIQRDIIFTLKYVSYNTFKFRVISKDRFPAIEINFAILLRKFFKRGNFIKAFVKGCNVLDYFKCNGTMLRFIDLVKDQTSTNLYRCISNFSERNGDNKIII